MKFKYRNGAQSESRPDGKRLWGKNSVNINQYKCIYIQFPALLLYRLSTTNITHPEIYYIKGVVWGVIDNDWHIVNAQYKSGLLLLSILLWVQERKRVIEKCKIDRRLGL